MQKGPLCSDIGVSRHPQTASGEKTFFRSQWGTPNCYWKYFQSSRSVSSPSSIPEANNLFVMFQQFFCCSYSVINHLAGKRTHTELKRQLILWHAAILYLVKRQIHSLIYMWEQQKSGKQQLNAAIINKKQTALFKTRTLLLLYLTTRSSTGFVCMTFGYWFWMKRQLLTSKNT